MRRIIAFGVAGGLASLLLTFTLYYSKAHETNYGFLFQYLGIFILGGAIFLGVRSLRNSSDFKLSFARGLFTGIMISFVFGIVMGTGIYVYSEFVNPELMKNEEGIEKNWEKINKRLVDENKTETEIAEMKNSYREQFKPANQMKTNIFTATFIGIIFSAIASAIIIRKN